MLQVQKYELPCAKPSNLTRQDFEPGFCEASAAVT
jgi:hypothetical protein